MTTDNLYINSKLLIGEIYNDYNIESDDFITRFPHWCYNCLEELKIIQDYTPNETNEFEFDNGLIPLPFGFKGIIDVIINNKKASLKNPLDFDKKGKNIDETYPMVRTPYIQRKDEFLMNENTLTVSDNVDKILIITNPIYEINGNYIHTNIEYGTIKLRYKSIPTIYDSSDNIVYPLIYDIGVLRKAIKLYVMKQILLRGYKHPVLNLKENNKYTNPGLEYDSLRYIVKNACNSFTKDRREAITNILTKGGGL